MKKLLCVILSLVCLGACAVSAWAADMDQLPANQGESTVFFVVALVIAIGGGIYLYFKLKK